ncbi:alcohol dehydrogenase, propanol-preferring [Cryobacterium psychrotolerans]|uniref:alcohol dehydrogenase n=2 Tax=Microbacteriaceae TaxID=85023 RepID=A0A1G8ZDI3_9MICO|nr:alcohol dehydrogenase, propanol-preferring [Cryobacterium psychrotolerans]
MESMRAWTTDLEHHRVEPGRKPVPTPAADEVLVKVLACGVCRTDLHVVDGELAPHHPAVTPGHQVVGSVVRLGIDVGQLRLGDLVGIAWLRRTCGACQWCQAGRENLCPQSQYTGWDADGGFAEYATVPESFAYLLAEGSDPVETAPLLCAGIIGYRALTRAALPPGGRLGLYGFGSSAHITAQLALAAGAEVFAMTRGEQSQALARTLGASFVGEADAVPTEPLDSAIIFAPAGTLVPPALRATARGGTVVLAGIHVSRIPALDYDSTLFYERDLRSVTSNTRTDGRDFLKIAHNLGITPSVTAYPFGQVDSALDDLRAGSASGSLVIDMTLPG